MATAKQQSRWRARQRSHSRQLNVMAHNEVHDKLEALARSFNLSGKGEAVAFCCFIADGLAVRADADGLAASVLGELAEAFHELRNRTS